LPGGFVDANEAICDAVEREVLEETGVEAEYVGTVGLRELLEFKNGAQDLYFVNILIAKQVESTSSSEDNTLLTSGETPAIKTQDVLEIAVAKWV
jgi:ADP-ribose pyrophosphatase YjhB (NUDIX family)